MPKPIALTPLFYKDYLNKCRLWQKVIEAYTT